MVVTPHAGGRLARVRLTNRYGSGPVTFDAARLARRAAGAGVVAGTSRPVTFGGRRSVTRLKVAGLRVHLGTLTPSGGHGVPTYGSPAADAIRRTVNRWIRSSPLPDTVIDFERAVRDPTRSGRLRPAYDSGDRLHPNARGYRAMGNAIRLSALRGRTCGSAGASERP